MAAELEPSPTWQTSRDAARAVVVGGGLSGLLCALELDRRGCEVEVVEAADRPGGVAVTEVVAGHRLEPAVGTFLLPHPALTPLLERAGVAMVSAPTAGRRWIFSGRKLVELSPGPGAIAAPVLTLGAKLSAILEPFRPFDVEGDVSLAELLRARLGEEAGSLAASVMASGVFAGDPERLSARAAFPALFDLLDAEGSLLRGVMRRRRQARGRQRPSTHLPVGGMVEAARTMAEALGDAYRPSFQVRSIGRHEGRWVVEGPERLDADHIVVAIRPEAAASILPGPLSMLLESRAPAAPVAVVFLAGDTDDLPIPDGFGYLVSPQANQITVGVLFESSLDPMKAPDGRSLVKVIAGGARHPDVVSWDDQEIVSRVGEELAAALGRDVTVDLARVIRHIPGIPQYEVGHLAWLDQVDRALSNLPGLHLAGWGYRGAGVGQLALDAVRIGDAVVAR